MEEYGPSERHAAAAAGHWPTAQPEAKIRHNCRVKTYPDGTTLIMIADRAIFRAPGWEEAGPRRRSRAGAPDSDDADRDLWDRLDAAELSVWDFERIEAAPAQRAAASLARAQRRARNAVKDLSLSNDFQYFVTLTLDAAKVDRYSITEVTRKLNQWLDNHVRRDGLAYVLVPERHKDGAIHFHGLFNGALAVTDSGTVDRGKGKPQRPRSEAQRARWLAEGGHVVYNLPAWTLGFTTAIELYGERKRAVNYVAKYIGKQMQPDGTSGKIGGRWYYSGGALRRPAVTFYNVDSADFSEYDGYEFVVDDLGARVKIIEAEGGGTK